MKRHISHPPPLIFPSIWFIRSLSATQVSFLSVPRGTAKPALPKVTPPCGSSPGSHGPGIAESLPLQCAPPLVSRLHHQTMKIRIDDNNWGCAISGPHTSVH
ncbi:hypothetical protein EV126DRAFT_423478 [Verticillium dahliae]|nr:hypothetical protein EV126DRAFT_423478 [Verticillium dahliae]